jgi:hypothetical protein
VPSARVTVLVPVPLLVRLTAVPPGVVATLKVPVVAAITQ